MCPPAMARLDLFWMQCICFAMQWCPAVAHKMDNSRSLFSLQRGYDKDNTHGECSAVYTGNTPQPCNMLPGGIPGDALSSPLPTLEAITDKPSAAPHLRANRATCKAYHTRNTRVARAQANHVAYQRMSDEVKLQGGDRSPRLTWRQTKVRSSVGILIVLEVYRLLGLLHSSRTGPPA